MRGQLAAVASTALVMSGISGALVVAPAAALGATAGTATPGTVPLHAAVSRTVGGSAPRPAADVVGGAGLAAAGVLTDRPAGVPAPPPFEAASWVLADAGTGAVIAAKGAHARHLPASTLKALTVLSTLPHVVPATPVQILPTDIVEGSRVGLVPGSTYTVQQLLDGTILASGNDSATALARAAGGIPATVARMQAEADRLGARDTVVRNPSGLDDPAQLTSAYDLALVAREGLTQPRFAALVATKRVTFPGKEVAGAPRETFQVQNHNTLLYNYPGAIGVKNGYTVAARWTMVGAARRDGRTYVLTALKRSERSWRTPAAVLDWAFRYGEQTRPVGRLVDPGELAAAPAQPVGAASRTPPATADQPLAGQLSVSDEATPGRALIGMLGLAAALLSVAVFALNARAQRRRLLVARRELRERRRQQPSPAPHPPRD